MAEIPFTVTARAARLIGRENVATSQGAVTELVKNSYDADAKVCAILFVPRAGAVPSSVSEREFTELSLVLPNAEEFFPLGDGQRRLDPTLDAEQLAELKAGFAKLLDLWIIDNGHGMSSEAIQQNWMVIGTDSKELNDKSEGGRIVTGAKGIGRFALDRLGQRCELYSAKSEVPGVVHWVVDWGDFEGSSKVISDVKATLETEARGLGQVYKAAQLEGLLPKEIPSEHGDATPISFNRGTAIRISSLHDQWDRRDSLKLQATLAALLPPKDRDDFNIFVYDCRATTDGAFIQNPAPDQFDYRMQADVQPDGKVVIRLDRQEIDPQQIAPGVFDLEAMQKPGYQKVDFERGYRTYTTDLEKLFPKPKKATPEEYKELIDDYRAIGPISFTLYFFKLTNPGRGTLERYPQKNFDVTKRRDWLTNSGGIRLYRDDFRVRPYGEPNTQGSDWLLLGERVAKNPSQVSRMGWRVPPQQLAGTIHISKAHNPLLADQSNREGIMNERAFSAFRSLILALIGEFERDRAYIYVQFDAAFKEANVGDTEADEGRELAKQVLESEGDPPPIETHDGDETPAARQAPDGEPTTSPDAPEENGGAEVNPAVAKNSDAALSTPSTTRKIAKAYKSELVKNKSMKEDIQVLRGMATLGTVLVSFTHELKQIKANMESRSERMTQALQRVTDPERLRSLPTHANPFSILERWSREDQKVSRWVDFALSAVSPSKRRRKGVKIGEYLTGISDYWFDFLESKSITLSVSSDLRDETILAHEIDLDSIFYNLIVNSVEAFIRPSDATSRSISITAIAADQSFYVEYEDNGPGLTDSLNIASDIFLFGVTSKSIEDEESSGTGIGMWILKNIVDDYGGEVRILSKIGSPGFSLSITLPLHQTPAAES
jgi:signal transduction histidine kinase